MTRSAVVRRSSRLRIAAITYVAIALAGTAAVLIAVGEHALPRFVILIWLLYLGPIRMVADVFAAATDVTLFAPGPLAIVLGAACTLVHTGAACLNVLVLRRLRLADEKRAGAERVASERRGATGVLFALAGAAFVVLTFVAGFFFLVAYGIDVPTPDPARVRLQSVAAASWLIGLVVASAGLLIWIRGLVQHRRTLRFAIADLAVLVTLAAVVVVNSSVGVE